MLRPISDCRRNNPTERVLLHTRLMSRRVGIDLLVVSQPVRGHTLRVSRHGLNDANHAPRKLLLIVFGVAARLVAATVARAMPHKAHAKTMKQASET